MIYLLITFLSFLNIKPAHEKAHVFHLSKTDITFKPSEKSLQITMHIFIDDLEAALAKQGHNSLFVGTEREKQETNTLIYSYLQKVFLLKVNNKNISVQWVGKEPAPDRQALWVYLEVLNIKDVKQIAVENKLLTEVYDDQKNIVQINVPSKKQGYLLLDKNKTGDSASFQ